MAKILAIDDQKPILKNLNYLLTKIGEVKVAENGKLGLELTRSFKPDLIVLDMHMPDMDGYTVAQTLRKEGYKGIILALTASVQKSTINKCFLAGCNYYLSKPFDPTELLKKTKEYLNTPIPQK